jgi:hypothetical protein
MSPEGSLGNLGAPPVSWHHCRTGGPDDQRPWREGDAGHHAELDRATGETLNSPTVTPTLQRLAAQAAREPGRVFTTLAPLLDENGLHEAYRHTSKWSAAGIDRVTATR